MATDDEVANFYTALEGMLLTVRKDQEKLGKISSTAAHVLILLESKLERLDQLVEAAAAKEGKAQAAKAAQELTTQLSPVVTAAREARESFDRNANDLTRRLKRSVAFSVTGTVITGAVAMAGVGLGLLHWMPWHYSPSKQAQAIQDLAGEARANAFYREHARIGQCTTRDGRSLTCVRVLAKEGLFSDPKGGTYYAIDPGP